MNNCFCGGGGATEWGSIIGTLSNQTDLINYIEEKTKNKQEKYLNNKSITIWDNTTWYDFTTGLDADTYYSGQYKTSSATSVDAYEISRVQAEDGTGTIEFLTVTSDTLILCKCNITLNDGVYTSSWSSISFSGGGTSLDSYPVGSYYYSSNSTSPASLFGGSWEQLPEGSVLMSGSINGTYKVGTSYGSNEHTMTENELYNHNHSNYPWVNGGISYDYDTMHWVGVIPGGRSNIPGVNYLKDDTDGHWINASGFTTSVSAMYAIITMEENKGSTQSWDNKQQSQAVYIWHRIA